jgi:hypothetical protein
MFEILNRPQPHTPNDERNAEWLIAEQAEPTFHGAAQTRVWSLMRTKEPGNAAPGRRGISQVDNNPPAIPRKKQAPRRQLESRLRPAPEEIARRSAATRTNARSLIKPNLLVIRIRVSERNGNDGESSSDRQRH